ncbi:hypothetical protein CAPTEDRAFT_63636, partial [Capitella teleta]
HSDSVLRGIFAKFCSMREAGEMVDVALVFDGMRINCHRLVLSATCEYFSCMFKSNMQERFAKEIPIADVSSRAGLLLVEYLYTGKIEITAENAHEIMAVSDRFILKRLKKNAENFLCEHVASTNFGSLMRMAYFYNLDSLMLSIAKNHWKKVVAMEDVDLLREDHLVTLLRAHPSDEDSFRLLLRWARSSEERTKRFMVILHNVKLAHFSQEFIWDEVMTEELMQNARGIQMAMDSLRVMKRHQSLSVRMPTPKCARYHMTSVCSSPQGFIVSGGQIEAGKTSNACYAYRTITCEWQSLPPMIVGRHSHASLYHCHEFMVIGGRSSEDDLDSVERLDIKTREWSQFPPLPQPHPRPHSVIIQNKLFVLSGSSASGAASCAVYEFDSAARSWIPRCPMPEESRGGSAVAFDDRIFVVGGHSKSCMQYVSGTDSW